MYEYGKIIINFITPFISELQSDTIFGHFAWGLRYKDENKLNLLMQKFENEPFIIFSDAFLKDFLPKPFFSSFLSDCNELEYVKQVKKSKYIQKDKFFENINNLSSNKVFEIIKNQEINSNLKVSITQKNSINRFTNLVEEGLYTIKEKFNKDEYEIYFKYKSDLITKKEIEEIFEDISKIGYGKDRSTGKGRFKFRIDWNFKEKNYFIDKKRFYLNLSTCFYNPKNMVLIYGKTITKFPKAGSFYSNEPYKNPSIMYLPGSIFMVDGEIVGKAENLYNKKNHYQNGFSIGIYFDGEVQ